VFPAYSLWSDRNFENLQEVTYRRKPFSLSFTVIAKGKKSSAGKGKLE